jgi:hypothetical protein
MSNRQSLGTLKPAPKNLHAGQLYVSEDVGLLYLITKSGIKFLSSNKQCNSEVTKERFKHLVVLDRIIYLGRIKL